MFYPNHPYKKLDYAFIISRPREAETVFQGLMASQTSLISKFKVPMRDFVSPPNKTRQMAPERMTERGNLSPPKCTLVYTHMHTHMHSHIKFVELKMWVSCGRLPTKAHDE